VFRVVFDTVVFVRALINSRSICGRLVLDFPDRYRLFLSRQVLQEILEVLARRELLDRLKLRGIDYRKALEKLLDAMTGAETVELANIAAVSRDPKDDKFLATAKAARSDFLVTEDQDSLVLRDYEGTAIVNAATFLAILEAEEKESDGNLGPGNH
jgi:putative PIN family toxin of toxin-antitoxin system